MKRRGDNVTIMLHRDGDVHSRSVRLPVWLFRTLAVAGTVVGVLILLGVVLYTPIVRTAARVPGLNREIADLRAENAKVTELARTLEGLESRYEQVRSMLGGDIVPSRAREVSPIPIARPLRARYPGTAEHFEREPSVPRHWPVDGQGMVTRGVSVGERGDEPHAGLDIAIPVGTPIRASGGGVVADAGRDGEYGLFVRLTHPDGFETMYGHASRLLVERGDSVTAGEVIALSGSTGRSTAPHLHFEIRRDGRSIDPQTLVQEGY
jgi:murein DD-endopeptidase MepM/ murein hydrolase activator NlpD